MSRGKLRMRSGWRAQGEHKPRRVSACEESDIRGKPGWSRDNHCLVESEMELDASIDRGGRDMFLGLGRVKSVMWRSERCSRILNRGMHCRNGR